MRGLKTNNLSPITRRRLRNFKANRRGYWSTWIFLALLVLTLPAEFLANDKPLVMRYKGELYLPVLVDYPESTFGGFLAETDYRDSFIGKEISANGWMVWPPLRYSYRTVNKNPPTPAPSPPSAENPFGTGIGTTGAAAEKAAKTVVATGASFDVLLARLKAGRTYGKQSAGDRELETFVGRWCRYNGPPVFGEPRTHHASNDLVIFDDQSRLCGRRHHEYSGSRVVCGDRPVGQ